MESIAIVVGPHANSRELNLASQQVRDAVTRAVETEGFVSVICADGEPGIIAELSFKLDARYRNANRGCADDLQLLQQRQLTAEARGAAQSPHLFVLLRGQII